MPRLRSFRRAYAASAQGPKTHGTSADAPAMIAATTSGKNRSKKAEGSGIVKKQRKRPSAKATRPLNSYSGVGAGDWRGFDVRVEDLCCICKKAWRGLGGQDDGRHNSDNPRRLIAW